MSSRAPVGILDKLLDATAVKTIASELQPENADDRTAGIMRFPQNPQATMLEGDAQRNVPPIILQARQEMERLAVAEFMKKKKASLRMGEGLDLPLSYGINTGTLDKLISFKSIFGLSP